jgi:hypothetical protein
MAALLADAGKLGDLDLRNRQRHECPTGSNWETIGKFGLRKRQGQIGAKKAGGTAASARAYLSARKAKLRGCRKENGRIKSRIGDREWRL